MSYTKIGGIRMDVKELLSKFEELDQVEAVAIGGSRASGNDDEKSDYDVYVYVTDRIEDDVREAILFEYCDKMEIGNQYWEFEDNVVLKSGIGMDIIYRNLSDMEQFMKFVVEDHNAMNGYTTCFWHNVITCETVFDKTGKFTALQEKCKVPYPQELKKNIIDRNMKLLSGVLPSYDKQVKKAYDRHDYVSINHRITGFLESYFDVIFALNEMTHPGEKKLVKICKEQCKILPANFEENILRLFDYMFKYDPTEILDDMVTELKKVL